MIMTESYDVIIVGSAQGWAPAQRQAPARAAEAPSAAERN
jgi:hypothetical protein